MILFRQFKQDLSKTKNWIIIGYSFNDEFIRNIFLEVFRQEGQNPRMLIIHPRAKEMVPGNSNGKVLGILNPYMPN